jgi:aryl-alcohol dehydrogenase-like predicted oxidoreductase
MRLRARKLGRTGIAVSPIGVGAMSFADFYGPTTEENSHAILHAALEAGVNFIDTSDIYGMGRSEEAIGGFLKARPEARDQMVICTKGGIAPGPQGRVYDNSAAYLETALDASLRRLGVDCVALYYVHRREEARPIEEVVQTLQGFVKKGKIRSYGFSEIAPSSLRRAAALGGDLAAVQSEYSLATRAPELGLVQACAELHVSLVAFSPVGRSMLTDHPVSQAVAATLPFLGQNPRFQPEAYRANRALSDGFRRLAAEMAVPTAALAIAWALHQGEMILPIPGTRSVRHFQELLRGAHLTLSAEDLARIEAVLPKGWAHGDRYSPSQWAGIERYC